MKMFKISVIFINTMYRYIYIYYEMANIDTV
jgi:hypothetical protein